MNKNYTNKLNKLIKEQNKIGILLMETIIPDGNEQKLTNNYLKLGYKIMQLERKIVK